MRSERSRRFRLRAALTALVLGLVCAVAVAQAERTVILVRHAEVVSSGRDPELSPAGRARALALAETLAIARPGLIIVSNTLRSRQTAVELAARTGARLRVIDVDGGDLDAHVRAVADAILEYVGHGAVVVVGHSNTLPRIATALGVPVQADLGHQCFDALWRVSLQRRAGVQFEAHRYGSRSPGCEASTSVPD